MNINEIVRLEIERYLVGDGCSQSVARRAADKGVDFFNQCNHKDPLFDSICHAGLVWAQHFDEKYKFKKPAKVVGKPFVYGKPKSRKHQKSQTEMF